MSYNLIRTKIEQQFFTAFSAAEPDVGIAIENYKYVSTDNDAWVRLNVAFADVRFPAISEVKERYEGLVQVQIFTPLDSGTADDERIADAIANIWRGVTIDGVYYNNSQKGVATSGEGWLQSLVSTAFAAEL